MASLIEFFAGLRRGFVMDELDAWAPTSLEDLAVPAPRPAPDHVIDLSHAVPAQRAKAS